jgi:uncharacterized protein (TIGR03083 family)
MAAFDEELAALLALDALEQDEQADAELNVGTFPAEMAGASAALAEGSAAPPPEGLRASALERALSRRTAGRPTDAAVPCEPLDGFRRTITDLDVLLASLSEPEWDLVAHPEHGRVRDLIAHLVGVEQLSVAWLHGDPVTDALDHVAATRAAVDEFADADVETLRATWRDAVADVVVAADEGDPDRPVAMHDIVTSVSGLLVMRTFELWAHSMDIADAVGRPMPVLDDERMATLSGRLMAAVPLALAYRQRTAPGRTARFVLTGPAGGCYSVPLHPGDTAGTPDVLVVADAVDLCRVAARRLDADMLPATVEGDADLARLVLTRLDAFARD